MFIPKLLTTLKSYQRQDFYNDLVAGIIVGIVALPLAIAFAIASGVTPDKGLYTAVIAGFIISALGGSRVQIGGPTGAFVVIVYGIVQQHGLDGLMIATMLAGIILVVMGFARLGGVIKFIPHPVVIGFTSGIALVIFSGQMKDFFGLQMGDVPPGFFDKWTAYFTQASSFTPEALIIAALTLGLVIYWPRLGTRIPGTFLALIVATAAAQLLDLPVETIGSRFGSINAGLPKPALPTFDLSRIPDLVAPAFTIAMLGAIESLLSAVVADGMIGGRHRSNMELVAQGVANIASPLFGGIPATGAIARTATNVKNGGRTPVAGLIHAATLLLITVAFGKWAAMIPLAALAGILVSVAYHMSEWRSFTAEFRAPGNDLLVMLATFGLTVVVDLTVAIEVGMVMAAFLFMKRMAEVTNVNLVTSEIDEEGDPYVTDPNSLRKRKVPHGVEIYEINGPFFFGAAEKFKSTLDEISSHPQVLIIRMRNVLLLDSTGLHALSDVIKQSRKEKTLVILSDVHAQPLMALGQSPLLEEVGEDNLLGNIDDALNRAREYLGLPALEAPADAIPTVTRERYH